MSSILVIVRCTGRLIGSRPWRLLVVLAVGPIAGCAATDSSRTIETTYSTPAQVAANDPVAPQSAESKSTGPAAGFREKPNPAPPALSSAPIREVSGHTVSAIRAAEPPGLATPMVSRADRDSRVKPVVNEAAIPAPSPLVMPLPAATYPIDLATALRLADVSNPTIGAARTMILEALALQLTARTLLLPSLNSGVTYRGHNGVLQRVSGKMIDVSLQQLLRRLGRGPVRLIRYGDASRREHLLPVN